MLLTCDVGNTNIVFGAFDEDKLVSRFRMGTAPLKTSDEYGALVKLLLEEDEIDIKDINDVIISSVVPEVMHSIENFSYKFIKKKPYIVGQGLKTGMNIKYQNPAQVGVDRIVNAVAAYEKYSGPLIVIDFGTATTFCAISKDADYLGGMIAPGIKISLEALFTKTSMLPKIEILKPKKPIGRSTVWAMQSGIYYGYVGLVDNITDSIIEEMGVDKVNIVSTGGLSDLILEQSKHRHIINKNLTLEGLKIIYDKNKNI